MVDEVLWTRGIRHPSRRRQVVPAFSAVLDEPPRRVKHLRLKDHL